MATKTVTIRLTDKAYERLVERAEHWMMTPTGYATHMLTDSLRDTDGWPGLLPPDAEDGL